MVGSHRHVGRQAMEKRAHPHPRGQQRQIGPGMRIITRDTHSVARSTGNNGRRTLQVFAVRHNGCPSSLSTSGVPQAIVPYGTKRDLPRHQPPCAGLSGRPLTPSRELGMTFHAKFIFLGWWACTATLSGTFWLRYAACRMSFSGSSSSKDATKGAAWSRTRAPQ